MFLSFKCKIDNKEYDFVKGNNVKLEDQGMKNENQPKKIGNRIYCGIEERIQ